MWNSGCKYLEGDKGQSLSGVRAHANISWSHLLNSRRGICVAINCSCCCVFVTKKVGRPSWITSFRNHTRTHYRRWCEQLWQEITLTNGKHLLHLEAEHDEDDDRRRRRRAPALLLRLLRYSTHTLKKPTNYKVSLLKISSLFHLYFYGFNQANCPFYLQILLPLFHVYIFIFIFLWIHMKLKEKGFFWKFLEIWHPPLLGVTSHQVPIHKRSLNRAELVVINVLVSDCGYKFLCKKNKKI